MFIDLFSPYCSKTTFSTDEIVGKVVVPINLKVSVPDPPFTWSAADVFESPIIVSLPVVPTILSMTLLVNVNVEPAAAPELPLTAV